MLIQLLLLSLLRLNVTPKNFNFPVFNFQCRIFYSFFLICVIFTLTPIIILNVLSILVYCRRTCYSNSFSFSLGPRKKNWSSSFFFVPESTFFISRIIIKLAILSALIEINDWQMFSSQTNNNWKHYLCRQTINAASIDVITSNDTQ